VVIWSRLRFLRSPVHARGFAKLIIEDTVKGATGAEKNVLLGTL